MKYAFFGTCFEDGDILIECLKTIANQSIPPNEVVIIDSSNKNILKDQSLEIFKNLKTSLIYENINLPRVKALNYAISKTNSDYVLRFDSRTRFDQYYAEESLKLFKKINSDNEVCGAVGGLQTPIPANNSRMAKIASEIMGRAYIFGNPLYRRKNYNGKVNSIYLGCFSKKVLDTTPYREEISLISEDSQLCYDIISKGYNIYMSQEIKLQYLSRNNVYSVLKLFRTYGRCRARTIISTKTIHDKKKFLVIFLLVFLIPILLVTFLGNKILSTLFVFVLIPFFYNFFHELFNYGYSKLHLPLIGLICQFNWFLGLLETFIFYNLTKNNKTNNFK